MEPDPASEGKKKEFLEVINSAGRLSITELSEKIGLDKIEVNRMAEQFRNDGKVIIEHHYLTEPDVESIEFNKRRSNLAEVSAKTIPMHTPEVPQTAITPIKLEEEKRVERNIEIILDAYNISFDDVNFKLKIVDNGDFVPHYLVSMPHIDFVTRALLDETKRSLIGEIQIESREMFDLEKFRKLRLKFLSRAKEKLKNVLKKASDEYISILSRVLVNEMIGLGDIEYMLLDDNIEEVVVNSSRDVVWVYHRKYGWLKTNIIVPSEDLILNYSARVAREVGREIT
ncbi:MAG: hypothetical protein NTU61_00090, partial [Candidatus Altiarchaeota archaeon]|nr:hypothetical protein [Candidatus Altiarchaeota archaeon]